MRKWILRIHLYGALLCSSYLILFGVSSLMFNHPGAFPKPREAVTTWERSWTGQPMASDQAEAESVRDGLGLFGWTYQTRRDPDASLHFRLSRPGKDYRVHVLRGRGIVRVDETPLGFWPILRGLHGLSRFPDSRLLSAWGWYTELCTIAVLFNAASGVYLWAGRTRHVAGWALLAGTGVLSLLFMSYLRVRG